MSGTEVDQPGKGDPFVWHEDVCLPKSVFKKMNIDMTLGEKLNEIKSITYQDGDVLVCSYPKTGTHWTLNLVKMLFVERDKFESATSAGPILLEVFPAQAYLSLPAPRVLCTHLKPDRYPSEFLDKAKLVQIVRNPKDACVSLYHHTSKMEEAGFKPSWDFMAMNYRQGPLPFGTYAEYLNAVQKWMEENTSVKVHLVYFEDLKKDGVGELRKLQDFLGLQHPDSHLQAVLDRCSVSKLKQEVDEGKVKSPLVDKEGKSVLYRKGEIGDWRNHYTVAQNEAFDKYWTEKMADSTFKFKYE